MFVYELIWCLFIRNRLDLLFVCVFFVVMVTDGPFLGSKETKQTGNKD